MEPRRRGCRFVRWGSTRPTTCRGRPTSRTHIAARLQSEAERAVADESARPITNLVPFPKDGGTDDGDPLGGLRTHIRYAQGEAVLVETTSARMGAKAAWPHHKATGSPDAWDRATPKSKLRSLNSPSSDPSQPAGFHRRCSSPMTAPLSSKRPVATRPPNGRTTPEAALETGRGPDQIAELRRGRMTATGFR